MAMKRYEAREIKRKMRGCDRIEGIERYEMLNVYRLMSRTNGSLILLPGSCELFAVHSPLKFESHRASSLRASELTYQK